MKSTLKSYSGWAVFHSIALLILMLGLSHGTALAAAPEPDEDGEYFCNINDNDGDDSVVIGPNKCCYEEIVNGDDLLTVCIQCDTDWKNCKEVSEGGSSRPRINLPAVGGGTINESRPRSNTAPTLKLK
jgi:hypothetical protein